MITLEDPDLLMNMEQWRLNEKKIMKQSKSMNRRLTIEIKNQKRMAFMADEHVRIKSQKCEEYIYNFLTESMATIDANDEII